MGAFSFTAFRSSHIQKLYSVPVTLTTVFVYGTLMPGERNAHVAGDPRHFEAQAATLGGFRLFHLSPEGYPALIPGGTGAVRGYALTYAPDAWAQALPLLDRLEGIEEKPPLYTRERVQVRLESGEMLDSWVYVYARPERLREAGATEVTAGDWRAREG